MCLTRHNLTVSTCIYACRTPTDTRDIRDRGALASLNLANNAIFQSVQDAGVMPALADALKKATKLTSLDISCNYMKAVQAEILAPALHDMGALSSLNISRNGIDSAQEATIRQICAGKSIQCTL